MSVVRNLTSDMVSRESLGRLCRNDTPPQLCFRPLRLALIAVVWLAWLPSAEVPAGNSREDRFALLVQQQQTVRSQFVSDLEEVAASCDSSGLAGLAAEVRQLSRPIDQQPGNIDHLPMHTQLDIPATLPPAERAVRVRVRKLQTDYANQLYLLSRKAITEQRPSLAYRLVREILFHDADHARARALMGYRRAGDEWTTPFAADKKKEGKVWHDEFGWIRSDDVARYAAGERLYRNNWISAAKEEILRSNFDNGWEIETEHFFIKTNYSQKKGAQLASSVETFHRYFMREFAAFFQTQQQLDKLFTSGTRTGSANRYDIDFFRLQSEFVNRLIKRCPSAGQINGIYMPLDRKVYFFHNPMTPEDAALDTLYHEVTHQLMSESSSQIVAVGHTRDFWAVEGIACYFESFRVSEEGAVTVGEVQHPRLQAARDQVVVTQDQEPLARVCEYGMLPFQKGDLPTLQRRYAQSTGLAHFFMNYKESLYRDGFIEYLSQIYSPDKRRRAKAKTLEEILGLPYATLDAQYAEYMRGLIPPEGKSSNVNE